jgi:hypothetical protein
MSSADRSVQEAVTDATPEQVLAHAKYFFATRPTLYAAFLDKEGPGFCSFRGQGGEEIVIAARPAPNGGTQVTASTYLYEMQVARFLSTLSPTGVA